MSRICTPFIDLIRVAIGTQERLSFLPTKNEWVEMYDMAFKQSLVGVCFAGLSRLIDLSDDGFASIGIDEELYYNWMGMAAQINMKNEAVNRQCVALQERLSAEGYRSSILKGQGIAALYGEELRGFRQSGDIDVYVDCGREKAVEFARSIHDDVDWDYKHLHLKIFNDTEVEMHYVPEVFLNLLKNRKLQRWFRKTEVASSMFHPSGDIVCPSVEFNLFYVLLHIYRHFLYEGVGMRQLMDYFFVLSNCEVDQSMRQRVYETVKSFGMSRFASGVMWIMEDVFGMREQQLVCKSDENEGHFILREVMAGGNFGHHDERLKDSKTPGKMRAVKKILKHNLHMLIHYPGDSLWAPIWIVYHWCWKRLHRI